jgi:hypothetical protein
MMDGWHILNLLGNIPGAEGTLLVASFSITISPRAFAAVTFIITAIHIIFVG